MRGYSTRGGQQAAFVYVRARTRFMVYGNTPARFQETDVWILSVPPEWVASETPGTSSAALTQRCGKAVAAQYAADRRDAIARAQAAAASTGTWDAGHYVMEGASIWLATDEQMKRRAWKGHHRFFYRFDDTGWRKAEDGDAPVLDELSPFEDAVYEGWRNEETGNWAGALAAHERALGASEGADSVLLGEVLAGRVRAKGKMKRFDDAQAMAKEGVSKLEALGAAPDDQVLIWVRLSEVLMDARPREAGEASDRALALLSDDDPRVPKLAQSAGLGALRQAQFAVARPRFERVVAAYDRKPPAPRDHAAALNNLALTLEHAGELARAEEHIRRAIQLHEKAGNASGVFDSKLGLARILARSGNDEAQRILDELRGRIRGGSVVEGLAEWAGALLLRAKKGDTQEIEMRFDRARQRLGKTPWSSWLESDRTV